MTKSTILKPGDLHLLPSIPRTSPLVLDFGTSACSHDQIAIFRKLERPVETILACVPSLESPVMDGFLTQDIPTIARLGSAPTIDLALLAAPRLASGRARIQLEFPLETEQDLTVLKLLSSLGVSTRLDMRILRTGSDVLRDVLLDAMLKLASRAPVSPFDELVRHFADDSFELSKLDYRSNDHFVDLRAHPGFTPAVAPPETWHAVRVREKRIPFLLGRHPCAFCEGLLYCHGYLLEKEPQSHLDGAETHERCKDFFSEFMMLFDLLQAKQQNQPGQQPGQQPPGQQNQARPQRHPSNGTRCEDGTKPC